MTKSIEARLAALADKAHELRARIRTLGESLSPEVVVDQAEELETLCGCVVAEARARASVDAGECKACAARAKRGLEGKCPACAFEITRSEMAAMRAVVVRAEVRSVKPGCPNQKDENGRLFCGNCGIALDASGGCAICKPKRHDETPEFADDETAEKIAAWLARQAGNFWAEEFARCIRRGEYKS